MTFKPWVILVLALINVQSFCNVKMKPVSFDEATKTFYVEPFKVTALNAPATINQTFAELLKDKVSRESPLDYTEQDPDIEFKGTISTFKVDAVAPQPGERTALNRLTITVSVEYKNNQNTKSSWTRSFSHFSDFDAEENLLQRQDELITVIFDQILEDIFNQAFNNW